MLKVKIIGVATSAVLATSLKCFWRIWHPNTLSNNIIQNDVSKMLNISVTNTYEHDAVIEVFLLINTPENPIEILAL